MKRRKPRTYEAKINGRKTRVTVPDDPDPKEILADALRENLSPHAVAAITAYIQPVRTMDPELVCQLRWFADLLTEVVGGEDELNRLCEEIGL